MVDLNKYVVEILRSVDELAIRKDTTNKEAERIALLSYFTQKKGDHHKYRIEIERIVYFIYDARQIRTDIEVTRRKVNKMLEKLYHKVCNFTGNAQIKIKFLQEEALEALEALEKKQSE